MRRGEVFWVDFGQPFGSEPGYRRPAVVIQADTFNESRIATVILLPLTKNRDWAASPGNVLLRPKDSGLSHPSVANVSQVAVADRRRLTEKIGPIPGRVMEQLDAGLRLVLDL